MSETETKTIDPPAVIEPVKAAPVTPVEEPAQTPKERMADIIAELPRASQSGVETLSLELASLLESM